MPYNLRWVQSSGGMGKKQNNCACLSITYVDMWIYFGFWLFNILKTYVKDNGLFERQL